jgi:putative spermidine/putrescine transport system permease protein
MTAARRPSAWAWLWLALGVLYFLLPLAATFEFSLRAVKDRLSFAAYAAVFGDPRFAASFAYSVGVAVLTILVSVALVVPTAYWVRWRLPRWRLAIEFIALLPFVVPAIVLAFGLIRLYSGPPFLLTETDLASTLLLVAAYVVLSLPYMFRAVDTGLRAIDVRTLTEAALSLGAGWPTILLRVILPNLRVAILSGAFVTFATVIGEFTLAVFLARPAFGPYMALLGQNRAYEPAALAILSFALTWGSIGLIQLVGRGGGGQGQLAGAR